MGIKNEIMNTVKGCDMRNFNENEKEGIAAAQISKWKKLNGRRYKDWLKSLVNAEESGLEITGDKETSNTDSSLSLSELERVDFLLRRVRPSDHAIRRNSPDLADQTDEQKEEFVQPLEEENKTTKTDFVEYWVPVKLSNIQTEQYCASLFSNSTVLCSSSKIDPINFLHDILVSTKQCCDHPYLVDRPLHNSLIKGIPQPDRLDAQIKLSSKLLLLHKALLEINKRGLRVLVLYQSAGGSGPITIGDILDDIIHEKFGGDSFVRFDGLISPRKRRAVLDTFNVKDGVKFVCLMDTRACVPSIKLNSMDVVIFFNSDWDPMNDLKALQKISLDSQFKQVKVFRLYSAYTVEEKVLMLAKQGTTPEGNVRSIKQSTCHELLTWGAYFLFKKLEDFHAVCTTDTDSVDSHGNTSVEDVFHELSVLLPNNDNSNIDTKSSLILEVQQIGGVYPSNLSLVGEVEYPLMDNFSVIAEMLAEEPPYVFWTNMLDGRSPSWRYVSCQSPRTRKSAQSPAEFLEECVGPSKRSRTEAGSTAGETPTTTRRRKRRRRRTSGEAAAPPPDDDDYLPSPEHSTGESPTGDAGGARKASQATHVKKLESVCKALQTELDRLEKQKTESSKQHEDEKVQTRTECEEEVARIRNKYEEMLQNADTAFLEEKQVLDSRYNKVLVNKALAEAWMQRDASNASISQVAVKFSVEQAYRLISQSPSPKSSKVAVGSVASSTAGSCLRAPAPHLRQMMLPSLPCTVHKLSSEPPSITFSPIILEKVTAPLPLLLPL